MSCLRPAMRRLATSSPSIHSVQCLCSVTSCPSASAPLFLYSVRHFPASGQAHPTSRQAPRSNNAAVASMGLPSAMPALHVAPGAQKTPMEWISEVPPKEVDGSTAVCEGGGGAMGHPIEYIQLNKVNAKEPSTCLYCGLRFVRKAHH